MDKHLTHAWKQASDREILVSRLIDRPLRPMLTEAWTCDTQVRPRGLFVQPNGHVYVTNLRCLRV